MVVVVGVDVVVVLLVPHVLLVAQLAVESGVAFLLREETERSLSNLTKAPGLKQCFVLRPVSLVGGQTDSFNLCHLYRRRLLRSYRQLLYDLCVTH